jgi:hypothetical protein
VLSSPRCASIGGFTLHANVAIPAADRLRLERLFRYCARPPIAIQRLELLGDGRILYRFKRPWRDGTTHIVFGPLEMIEKLSAVSEGVARLSGTPAGGPRGAENSRYCNRPRTSPTGV